MTTRQQIKEEEKAFIKSSQQAMEKISVFLQNRLKKAVIKCDNSDCVNRVTKNISEVQFQTKRFMDTLSAGIEKCISIESNKGIKGYSKCFKMYEYLLNYEIFDNKKMQLSDNNLVKYLAKLILSNFISHFCWQTINDMSFHYFLSQYKSDCFITLIRIRNILEQSQFFFQIQTFIDMQINQINWLHNKKSQLLKQILDLQVKSHAVCSQSDSSKIELQNKFKSQSQELNQLKKSSLNEVLSLQKKIQKLETLILKNQMEIQKKTCQNQQLNTNNANLLKQLTNIKESYDSQTKQQSRLDEFNRAKFNDQELSFTRQFERQEQKLSEVVEKYENLVKQKQVLYRNKYDKDVENMRTQNDLLIKQLQQKYSSKENTSKQDQTKYQKQYSRLLQEHKRLSLQLTQHKNRHLSLQSDLSAQKQQHKLKSKEFELKSQNYKKQIELIKQSQQRLISKNKTYMQKNQELSWEIKQLDMKYAEEIKRIKKTAQRDLSQIIQKSQQQVTTLKNQIYLLKNNQITAILAQNANLKRNVQLLSKQKVDMENQNSQKMKQISNLNKQFSEVLKVRQENQNLKKSNLKKCHEMQVLEQEIKRLKQKCNSLATAYQELIKKKQIMERQNKMLLEEIIFLRDKKKQKRQLNKHTESQNSQYNSNLNKQSRQNSILDESSNVLEMKSEVSQNLDDVQQYKQVIKQLDQGMQQALLKIDQKNQVIQKQKSMIAKMERIIAYGK